VITTFHAGSATEAVSRLSDMGIEPYLLRSGLLAILSQRLLRRLCSCAQPSQAEEDRLGLPVEQWKTATGGNPTMQIWLGKNMLGQTDKQEIDHNVNEMVGIKLILD